MKHESSTYLRSCHQSDPDILSYYLPRCTAKWRHDLTVDEEMEHKLEEQEKTIMLCRKLSSYKIQINQSTVISAYAVLNSKQILILQLNLQSNSQEDRRTENIGNPWKVASLQLPNWRLFLLSIQTYTAISIRPARFKILLRPNTLVQNIYLNYRQRNYHRWESTHQTKLNFLGVHLFKYRYLESRILLVIIPIRWSMNPTSGEIIHALIFFISHWTTFLKMIRS